MVFVFGALLGLNRSFAHEKDEGCLDGLLLCKVFPSVGIAFSKGTQVPLTHLTATGLICSCGNHIDLGRNEVRECEGCGKWLLHKAPDEIIAATPQAIEDSEDVREQNPSPTGEEEGNPE